MPICIICGFTVPGLRFVGFSSGLVQPGDVGAPLAGTRALPVPRYSQDIQNRGGEALYRGDALPGAPQEVRPEYRDSGRWIAQPGT